MHVLGSKITVLRIVFIRIMHRLGLVEGGKLTPGEKPTLQLTR